MGDYENTTLEHFESRNECCERLTVEVIYTSQSLLANTPTI